MPAPMLTPQRTPGDVWQANKQTWIALGLFIVGLWTGGNSSFTLLGLGWLAAIPLLALDAWNPPFYQQVPSYLRRPTLGAWVAALAVITVALPGGITPGWFILVGGTWVFLKDSLARGEAGLLDIRSLWRGWRRWMMIGLALASFTFSADWEPWTYVGGYSTHDRVGNWEYTYWHPGQSFGQGSGMAVGANTWLAPMLLAILVWIAWPRRKPMPSWWRYVPLALTVLAGVVASTYLHDDAWAHKYSGTVTSPPGGPFYFIVTLIPVLIGAIQFARGKAE